MPAKWPVDIKAQRCSIVVTSGPFGVGHPRGRPMRFLPRFGAQRWRGERSAGLRSGQSGRGSVALRTATVHH